MIGAVDKVKQMCGRGKNMKIRNRALESSGREKEFGIRIVCYMKWLHVKRPCWANVHFEMKTDRLQIKQCELAPSCSSSEYVRWVCWRRDSWPLASMITIFASSLVLTLVSVLQISFQKKRKKCSQTKKLMTLKYQLQKFADKIRENWSKLYLPSTKLVAMVGMTSMLLVFFTLCVLEIPC